MQLVRVYCHILYTMCSCNSPEQLFIANQRWNSVILIIGLTLSLPHFLIVAKMSLPKWSYWSNLPFQFTPKVTSGKKLSHCRVEICTGLVHCSRSRPVPAAVIPIPVLVLQWSIPLPSHSRSFRSCPGPAEASRREKRNWKFHSNGPYYTMICVIMVMAIVNYGLST